jgi:hypothetical protein
MMNRFHERGTVHDHVGRDMALAEALEALDPESLDPNYWLRFKGWVLAEAGPELARRRLMAELTVVDVLSSWSRAIFPTALVAAVVAGLVLVRTGPLGFSSTPAAEVVAAEFEIEPVLLSPDAAPGLVAFASDTY